MECLVPVEVIVEDITRIAQQFGNLDFHFFRDRLMGLHTSLASFEMQRSDVKTWEATPLVWLIFFRDR